LDVLRGVSAPKEDDFDWDQGENTGFVGIPDAPARALAPPIHVSDRPSGCLGKAIDDHQKLAHEWLTAPTLTLGPTTFTKIRGQRRVRQPHETADTYRQRGQYLSVNGELWVSFALRQLTSLPLAYVNGEHIAASPA